MTLREKILKTFVVAIRDINQNGGPEEFFKKYPVGGMYFCYSDGPYDENGNEVSQGCTYEKLERCKKASPNKLLICVDGVNMVGQELSARFRSIAAGGTEEDAYNMGKAIAMQCNSRGVDWLLGPCIDMFNSPLMPLDATTNDPELTAKIFKQVVRGLQDNGICATAKHFPGQGTTNDNMHLSPANNVLPFDEWMRTYGYTYKAVIDEDVLSIMTTHTALQSYDNEFTDGYYPIATYSKKLTQELLKEKLGFKGAVVTDALIMGGMATGDLVEETAQAFKCGADLLLWPPIEAADRIEELILSGEIPMSRLDDALERIERMENFRNEALKNKTYAEPDVDFINNTYKGIVQNGIACLKNDIGLLPLSTEKYKNILIVDGVENDNKVPSENLKAELESRGANVTIYKREVFDPILLVCWQSDIDKIQKDFDLVIFNMSTNLLCSWEDPYMIIWASHMFDKKKKLIINYGSPFFTQRYFPEDPTIVETNAGPSKFCVKYLVDRLFGDAPFTGKSVIL